ncbi:TPA: hypothetical protein EYP38_05550, partial [Candidatus Micrarchaeota archaeon]|nr:hypothetical protein [Candidatus Micrarchaeota archaeon]
GASVFRTPFGKEVAVRILTGYITRVAAKYDKAVRPLLTYYVDHYVRGYYVVERGASKASRALKELGALYYCGSCHNVEWVKEYPLASGVKECSFCGGRAFALGPLYLGTLHDAEFVSQVEASLSEAAFIGSPERLSRLIALLKHECGVATPFYYRVDLLSSRAGVNMPSPARLVETLRSEGYRASLTHFDPRGVKTEAPLQIVYELLKALKSHHPRS